MVKSLLLWVKGKECAHPCVHRRGANPPSSLTFMTFCFALSSTDFKQQQPFDYGLRTLRIAHRSWGRRAGWEADDSERAKEAECTVHTYETVQEHVSSIKIERNEKLSLE